MKIIIKKDLRTLGRTGDIKEVKDGYARNYLIPKGIAVLATKGNIKSWETAQEKRKKKREQENKALSVLAEKLSQVTLSFSRSVNEEGVMFGSVAKSDIIKALKATDLNIERDMIDLKESIKAIGNFEVNIYFNSDISGKVKIAITPKNN